MSQHQPQVASANSGDVDQNSNHRAIGRLFGLMFISTFVFYGGGTALVDSVALGTDILARVQAGSTALVSGVVMMAIAHTFFNIALPVLLFPILKPFSERLSLAYLGLAIASTIIVAMGAIFRLTLVPLSTAVADASSASLDAVATLGGSSNLPIEQFEMLAVLLNGAGNISYQLGMAVWCGGGIMLCAVLLKSRLVPQVLSVWGLAGYAIFMVGSILELFGYGVGVMLAMPGGLFEIFISFWLIFKGFSTSKVR